MNNSKQEQMERTAEIRKVIRQVIREEISRMTAGRYSTKGANIESDVPTFFVVTKPMFDSDRVEDIVFEADPISFANQIRGGLKEEEITLLTTNEQKAMRLANKLLGKETLDSPTESKRSFFRRRLFMRERRRG